MPDAYKNGDTWYVQFFAGERLREYRIEDVTEKTIVLRTLDPAGGWQVARYLIDEVIMVERASPTTPASGGREMSKRVAGKRYFYAMGQRHEDLTITYLATRGAMQFWPLWAKSAYCLGRLQSGPNLIKRQIRALSKPAEEERG